MHHYENGVNSNDEGIYLVITDGSEVRRVVGPLPLVRDIAWSSDGQKISYCTGKVLNVIYIDGKGGIRLVDSTYNYFDSISKAP